MSKLEQVGITGKEKEYDLLLQQVGQTLESGRQNAAAALNSAMLMTYWEIGR